MGKIIGYALGFGLISFVLIYMLGALLISGQGGIEFVTALVIWTLPGIIIGSACGVCQALKQGKKDGDDP